MRRRPALGDNSAIYADASQAALMKLAGVDLDASKPSLAIRPRTGQTSDAIIPGVHHGAADYNKWLLTRRAAGKHRAVRQ